MKKKTITTPSKKPKKVGTTISDKDQKILWSRAAGRCSISDCRVKLTMDKSKSESVTLGEMCHIVGEKNSKVNARGLSSMPLPARNKYSNLVLMCAHHHKIIDRNEKKFTIEILHSIKDEHELWVEETLSARTIKPDELVYSKLIDYLTESLQLEQWNWFTDNAIRQLVHSSFIKAHELIIERQLATVFPGTKPQLESAIKNIMQSYVEYIEQFLLFATRHNDREFLSADVSYKKPFPNPNYHYFSDIHSLWARKNFIMLCKYTVSVNDFAKAVRQHSNPLFFVVKGNFILIDSLGTHLGEWGTMLLPTESGNKKRLVAINNEINEFKKNNPAPKGYEEFEY